MDTIPPNIRTILQNQLNQWKKHKQIRDFEIKLTENLVQQYEPPSRTSTCTLTITYDTMPPYQTIKTSHPYSTKKDAERHAVYLCYQQLTQDSIQHGKDEYHYIDCGPSSSDIDNSDDEGAQSDNGIRSSPKLLSNNSIKPLYKQKHKPKLLSLFPVEMPDKAYPNYIYILVDTENKPKTDSIERLSEYGNIKIIKFVGKQHANRKLGNIHVDSMYRDAADHAISFYMGALTASFEGHKTIIVYTGDRFASANKEFCSMIPNMDVQHMAHGEDILHFLDVKFNKVFQEKTPILSLK